MVLATRQRADKVSLSFSQQVVVMTVTISFLILVDPIHGQPNYYFKASAPAVKSLPRIGRRSDDGLINDGGSASLNFPRSMDVPGGILVWQASSGGGGPQLESILGSSGGSSGGSRSVQSLVPPIPSSSPQNSNQMSKALLWRKLFGDVGANSYDDLLSDSFYSSRS